MNVHVVSFITGHDSIVHLTTDASVRACAILRTLSACHAGADPDPRTEVYGERAPRIAEVPGCDGASWQGLKGPLQPPDAKVVFGEGPCLDEEEPLEGWTCTTCS